MMRSMIKHVRYSHCLDETNKAVRCRKKVQGLVDGDSCTICVSSGCGMLFSRISQSHIWRIYWWQPETSIGKI